MKKIFRFLTSRWLVALLGILALAILIWFAGPLLAFAGWEPLASATSRALLILLILLAWGLNRLRIYLAARRRNRRMLEGLASAPPDPTRQESEAEIAALRQRFDEALRVLKKARLGRRSGRQYLYQLPWYMMIGPPGSGKTTALVNSGLQFPLAERFGEDAIRGVGGTRNCDWWFTDEAVLLDTAGRYTTQDSHQDVDSAAWTGFLQLLKKYRRRRPINGAVVAISLSDLMSQDETERAAHARAIRQRIQELHQYLGIRFPIYVLFTKCDLVAGFMEFFDDLGREERTQIWGTTFPLDDLETGTGVVGQFAGEFDALEQRLNARLVERLQQERDPQRRDLIYAFPQQFSSLKEIAGRFLTAVFQPTRFEERALLRGVYFTSGTQVGTPIDRIMASLSAGFGLDRKVLAAFTGSGRSYFITRLFRDVLFQEAGLAGTNLRLERQRLWLQRGAYAAALTLTVLAAAAWFVSFERNQRYVQDVQQRVTEIDSQARSLSAEQRDVLAVLPLLNAARDIPGGYGDRDAGVPWLMRLGLYQGDKLGVGAVGVYRRVLNGAFLPRLILRLEQQLRQAAGNPDYLYETLKVYLMLDDPAHLDSNAVEAWMALDWERNLPRGVTAEQRQQLRAHLDALLEELPVPLPIALDADLIAQVRRQLTQVPAAQRIYARLKHEGLGENIPDFRVSEAAGRDAPLVFVRGSGKPLNTGIPGLYTYAGYHQVFMEESRRRIAQLADEGWILGPQAGIPTGLDELRRLTDEVRQLYLTDYARQWDELLSDIQIAPFTGLPQAVAILNILSAPNSPLRSLLEAVERQTTLERATSGAPSLVDKAQDRLSAVKNRLAQLIEGPASNHAQAPPAKRPNLVEERFAALDGVVQRQGDTPPPLDRILSMLNELYVYMNAIASAADRGDAALQAARNQAAAGSDIIARLKLEASRQPPPLNRWLQTLAEDSSSLTLGGVRAYLNTLWTSTVLPLCRQGISDRYPLSRNSPREATLDDFGRFFGPGGLMDDFFQKYLQPFVDTTRNPWSWRASGDAEPGVATATLAEFQRAAAIRDAFFRAGGKIPSVSFQLKPISMDADVNQFSLDLDGQRITYSHGPTRPESLQWPGPNGPSQVQIRFSPPASSGRSGLTEDGPWAWFRILDQSRLEPTSQPELFTVTFAVDGRTARYELRASSAFNPFHLKALEQFRCPERL